MDERHFALLIDRQADRYGDRNALYYRDYSIGQWIGISWNDFRRRVRLAALNLIRIGVREEEPVGIFSHNKPEGFEVDFANFWNRSISVPIYATNTAEQITYFIDDARIRTLFVGEQYQHDVAVEALGMTSTLERVIVFDESVEKADDPRVIYYSEFLRGTITDAIEQELDARRSRCSDDDVATIMYTSGSTGVSKGVVLPHSCYIEAMRIHEIRLPFVDDTWRSLAFIPTTHIFERGWSYYCLHRGARIYINLRPTDIQMTLKEVRPDAMCSVPRFWEKVSIGIRDKISHFSPIMLGVVTWAIAVGKKYNIDYLKEERTPGRWLRFRYRLAERLVFSKLKTTLGIENTKLLPTAGASLSDDIAIFFRSIGVPITYGYGLTESLATVCCYDRTKYVFGSLGRVMPDLQVKIGENNEILLKGKTIFREYLNQPELTRESFTPDGFFRTGDAGRLEGEDLFLTERLKDLFKTSNGKYIAPQQIEMRLLGDKYIEQALAIGDKRNFVTAIIAPNLNFLKEYAEQAHITYQTVRDLLQNRQIYDMIKERIDMAQKGMAGFERIKKFLLIEKPFSLEAGELTNTLKIKRTVVMQKYKAEIDAMYASPAPTSAQ